MKTAQKILYRTFAETHMQFSTCDLKHCTYVHYAMHVFCYINYYYIALLIFFSAQHLSKVLCETSFFAKNFILILKKNEFFQMKLHTAKQIEFSRKYNLTTNIY